MPQATIRNRRPVVDQPAFEPIPDGLKPAAATTSGNVTLPAGWSVTLTPGQSITKSYGHLTPETVAELLQMARDGFIHFPGAAGVDPGLPVRQEKGFVTVFCLNGEEPTIKRKEGDVVHSITDGKTRTFDGQQWVTTGQDSWFTYPLSPTPQSRAGHAVVTLASGEVMSIGGGLFRGSGSLTATIPAGKTQEGEEGAICQRFDPVSGVLKDACPMPSNNVGVTLGGRQYLFAFLLPNGLVLAGGGLNFDIQVGALFTDPNIFFSDWWLYDPATDDWTATTDSPETMAATSGGILLKASTRVFFAANNSASTLTWPQGADTPTQTKQRFPMSLHTFSYNWLDETWAQHGDLARRRTYATLTEMANGKVFIGGGFGDMNSQAAVSEICERWDPVTGLVTDLPAMPAIPDEEQTTSPSVGGLAIASIGSGSLFGDKAATVRSVRLDGHVADQYSIYGNVALASTTASTGGTGDSFAKSGSIMTLTDAAGGFTTKALPTTPIVIAGSTSPGNNGTFPVLDVLSNTQLRYINAAGVAEAFAGTWTLKRNDGTFPVIDTLYDTAGNFTRYYFYSPQGANQAGAGGTATITAVTPGRRYQPSISKIGGNRVLMAGGTRPPSLKDAGSGAVSLTAGLFTDLVPNSEVARKSAIVWDDDLGAWTRTGDLYIARSGALPFLLPDGKVLLVGGVSFNLGFLAACEIYDPASGTFTDAGLLNPVRDGNGDLVLFQGLAGNPPSGDSPAPGFVESNQIADNHFFAVVPDASMSARIVMMFGEAVYITTTSSEISVYRIGAPSLGHHLEHL